MNKNANEADIVEKIGPYELVARFINGKHVGVLWRSGKRLIEVEAKSNEEAKVLLESRFYEMQVKRSGETGNAVADDKELANALMYIWPHLNPSQQTMIQAQYRAPKCRMTTLEMAKAAGYKSHHPVNLFYGQAGFMLFSELPRSLPTNNQTGAPIYSFMLSEGVGEPKYKDGETWIWELRPEVARGLKLAGLVA